MRINNLRLDKNRVSSEGKCKNLGGEEIEGGLVAVGAELDAVSADVVLDDFALLGLLLGELLVAGLPRSGLSRVKKARI